MALPRKIDSEAYAKLPKVFQESYKQDGDDFVLSDVEGYVSKDRLEEFRNNNRALQAQIEELMEKSSKFSEDDITELSRLREERQAMEEKDLIERGEIDPLIEKRLKPVQEAHAKALRERDEKITSMSAHLDDLLIRDKAQALAVKAGIAGDRQLGDFLRRVKDEFQVVDGKAVRMQDGEPVYGDDGSPSTLDDKYIETVKVDSDYLFRPAQGTGADPSGGQRRGGARNTSSLTAAQKIASGLAEQGLT